MMAIRNDMLQVGDYAHFAGKSVQGYLKADWWKVTSIKGTTVKLIDRTGATARVSTARRYQECHAIKWEPGDPKELS
jgi:hypothetical protein